MHFTSDREEGTESWDKSPFSDLLQKQKRKFIFPTGHCSSGAFNSVRRVHYLPTTGHDCLSLCFEKLFSVQLSGDGRENTGK